MERIQSDSKGRHWAFPGALAEDLGLDGDLTLHEKLEVLWQEDMIASTVDGLPEYRQYLSKSKGIPLQDIWSYQPYTQDMRKVSIAKCIWRQH